MAAMFQLIFVFGRKERDTSSCFLLTIPFSAQSQIYSTQSRGSLMIKSVEEGFLVVATVKQEGLQMHNTAPHYQRWILGTNEEFGS